MLVTYSVSEDAPPIKPFCVHGLHVDDLCNVRLVIHAMYVRRETWPVYGKGAPVALAAAHQGSCTNRHRRRARSSPSAGLGRGHGLLWRASRSQVSPQPRARRTAAAAQQ